MTASQYLEYLIETQKQVENGNIRACVTARELEYLKALIKAEEEF